MSYHEQITKLGPKKSKINNLEKLSFPSSKLGLENNLNVYKINTVKRLLQTKTQMAPKPMRIAI